MRSIELAIASSRPVTCRIRVGTGALDALVDDLAATPPAPWLAMIADDRVAPLHAEPLARKLRDRGLAVELLIFPAGEAGKTRDTKADLEDRLWRLGAGRDSALIAVGGGVTGDLAGFVAATWHRGIPVVQVPTSLLAMVDASLGGKTGVNLPGGKNLIGSFHQPWGVYADVSVLDTLPADRFIEGLAEVVKSAVIADSAFFEWLERSVAPILDHGTEALEELVHRSMTIKSRVVAADERESGRRAMLNFGHTVAHAFETVTNYEMTHGTAVAIGLCLESRLAVEAVNFPEEDVARLESLLSAFGLPRISPPGLSVDAVVAATHRDKKARMGRARYSLPTRLGGMPDGDDVTVEIDDGALRRVLASAAG